MFARCNSAAIVERPDNPVFFSAIVWDCRGFRAAGVASQTENRPSRRDNDFLNKGRKRVDSGAGHRRQIELEKEACAPSRSGLELQLASH